ncbi:hypothetical protein C8F04DRAFT_1202342 [Mycena alexandri]|uniref:Uncharacterized protein n=1 Tax=Mycena alexandri TaxID=1745969 RepID=A0AAD6RY18_9AGAR|nr:hypothetical protein C8F04DRAFT_1202342 [Mycena alexandri]
MPVVRQRRVRPRPALSTAYLRASYQRGAHRHLASFGLSAADIAADAQAWGALSTPAVSGWTTADAPLRPDVPWGSPLGGGWVMWTGVEPAPSPQTSAHWKSAGWGPEPEDGMHWEVDPEHNCWFISLVLSAMPVERQRTQTGNRVWVVGAYLLLASAHHVRRRAVCMGEVMVVVGCGAANEKLSKISARDAENLLIHSILLLEYTARWAERVKMYTTVDITVKNFQLPVRRPNPNPAAYTEFGPPLRNHQLVDLQNLYHRSTVPGGAGIFCVTSYGQRASERKFYRGAQAHNALWHFAREV